MVSVFPAKVPLKTFTPKPIESHHPYAGWRSAVIYSIIQSCRRRSMDPQEYLTDLLGRLPAMKNTEIDYLLPENWQAARAKVAETTGPPSPT